MLKSLQKFTCNLLFKSWEIHYFQNMLHELTVIVIASDACWKRFCLRRTETCSAFGVLRECAIQIYFYLLTYLL